MEETIFRKQYVTPALTITAIRMTDDVLITSPVEEYKDLVIDDGDWGDWGDGFDESLSGM